MSIRVGRFQVGKQHLRSVFRRRMLIAVPKTENIKKTLRRIWSTVWAKPRESEFMTIKTFCFLAILGIAATPSAHASNLCEKLLAELPRSDIDLNTQDQASKEAQDACLTAFLPPTVDGLATIENVGPANRRIKDQPFGDFEFFGAKLSYAALPPEVRGKGLAGPVFFGRRMASHEKARKLLAEVFQNGRTRRGPLYRDVGKYIVSMDIKDAVSKKFPAFLQSSKSLPVAQNFAIGEGLSSNGKEVGVVLVIDPKGAEVFDVAKAAELRVINLSPELAQSESEILFSESLPPDRIYGAIIIKSGRVDPMKGAVDVEVLEVIRNSNYRTPKDPRP